MKYILLFLLIPAMSWGQTIVVKASDVTYGVFPVYPETQNKHDTFYVRGRRILISKDSSVGMFTGDRDVLAQWCADLQKRQDSLITALRERDKPVIQISDTSVFHHNGGLHNTILYSNGFVTAIVDTTKWMRRPAKPVKKKP